MQQVASNVWNKLCICADEDEICIFFMPSTPIIELMPFNETPGSAANTLLQGQFCFKHLT